jgi:hypothetical protein
MSLQIDNAMTPLSKKGICPTIPSREAKLITRAICICPTDEFTLCGPGCLGLFRKGEPSSFVIGKHPRMVSLDMIA